MLDGRWMVRVSIGAELTERQHVEAAVGDDAEGCDDREGGIRPDREVTMTTFDIINPATSAVLESSRRRSATRHAPRSSSGRPRLRRGKRRPPSSAATSCAAGAS